MLAQGRNMGSRFTPFLAMLLCFGINLVQCEYYYSEETSKVVMYVDYAFTSDEFNGSSIFSTSHNYSRYNEAIKIELVVRDIYRMQENMHQGYPTETLVRFLKARDGNVAKAHKMLIDCLQWRVENEIDNVLAQKPIPPDLYRGLRDSQLTGMSGVSKEGLPVIAVGVGLSTLHEEFDKYYPTATKTHGRYIGTCVKVLDMTGLKLSALKQLRLLTSISTIDDLNYPEKTDAYYIVNAPYVFSACWKVVKPLLQERTRRKVHVLKGCGMEELLKVMDYASLPHFCRKEDSRLPQDYAAGNTENCFSFDHVFHQQLYNYITQQVILLESISQIRRGSFHVELPEPDPDDAKIAKTIETEFHKLEIQNGLTN
ncbi:SEC14 cytosolic factor-like isoform X3 [Abrus precatorius]|uniref:SEC14 cytosolic factor-like isoform X3 n=1 Tax=Abrus precatorius TaxID=3816 RepID=A0A8B8JHN2_ABRPR|nr:SEC14 cytosolic factor-like isoform X3 [Abrus precatorius]